MVELKVMGYSRTDLMSMAEAALRALIRERTHHTVEVLFNDILVGRRKAPERFGESLQLLLDVWRSRGLPMDGPDLQWSKQYLELAGKLSANEIVSLNTSKPSPFTEEEMKAVRKLIYDRRSIRAWERRKVPSWMIREILKAGIAAPCACNLGGVRFIVSDDPSAINLKGGHTQIENATIVIVCQDLRVYRVTGHQQRSPQNLYFDAASAAGHMLLMAHALGLGGIWLTHGEEMSENIRKHYGLSNDFLVPLHIAFGFPAEAPIKSQRMQIEDYVIAGLGP